MGWIEWAYLGGAILMFLMLGANLDTKRSLSSGLWMLCFLGMVAASIIWPFTFLIWLTYFSWRREDQS